MLFIHPDGAADTSAGSNSLVVNVMIILIGHRMKSKNPQSQFRIGESRWQCLWLVVYGLVNPHLTISKMYGYNL